MSFEITLVTVALAALITALATGLGALPLVWMRHLSREDNSLALGNAAAAGLMIAASFTLIHEGMDLDGGLTLLGFVLGMLFVALSDRFLPRGEDLHLGALKGEDAGKAILIIGVMTIHSAAEGVAVGVSFAGGDVLGLFITAAIAIHNVPEGLAIALVLVPRGTRVLTAALWAIFSSLPQLFLAVPAYAFVSVFSPLLPVGLGLAAGAMVWMTLVDLLPEAFSRARPKEAASYMGVAIAVMIGFEILVG